MSSLAPGSDCLVGGGPTAEPTLVRRLQDPEREGEKREALVQLRDRYVAAREQVSSIEAHENLEWILGARASATQDPMGFQTRTIELIALWLQDLSVELDRQIEEQATENREQGASSASAARQSNVQKLREATERFLAAFLPPTPAEL
jgi:hypothetical protein